MPTSTRRVDARPLVLGLLGVALVSVAVWWVLHRPVADAAPAPTLASRDRSASPAAPPGYRINLNSADAATLQLLPGVGPGLADNIINHRNQHGPLRSMDDLDRVRMIGPVLRVRLEPYVRFDEAEGVEASPARSVE